MRLQIHREVESRLVGDALAFLRRHAGQFGDARAFATWAEKQSKGLLRVWAPEGSDKAYVYDADTPEAAALAVCHESDWTVEPGRILKCRGRVVCALKSYSVAPGDVSPAEVDGLARRIVDLLNEKGVAL